MSAESAALSPALGLILLALFSVLWVALGWYWGRGAKTFDDYSVAGRNVGMALATATAMATWVTSNTTMVAPQLAYQMGVWGMVGYSLGSVGLLLFAPMAGRIRKLMPRGYTAGDFFRLRYGPAAWRVFLGISLFYGAGWLISLGMAGGILIQALSGIPYAVGMTVILAVCVLYTLLGGLKAVIGTDFVQTIIITLGVAVLAALAIARIGLEPMHAALAADRPGLLDLLLPASLMFLFNNLLFGMGEIFHSNVWWSRAFAFGKGIGSRAFLTAGLMWAPIPVAAGFLALGAPVLGVNVPAPDMVGPLMAAHLLGAAGAVLVFIVVFSALASSLDSLLAATSDLLVQDVFRRHIAPAADDRTLRRAASYAIVLLGGLTWLACLPRLTNLAAMLHLTGAFVASTIWPVAAGLYWKRTNPSAALWAMVLGSAAGLWAYYGIGFYVAALVGAAVSMTILVTGTLLRPRDFDWAALDESPAPSPGQGGDA